MAACRAPVSDVAIVGELKWTPVSDKSSYGFCRECSSPIFWRNKDTDKISVMSGSLDSTEGLTVCGHVFVSEKGDYYNINDGLPCFETYPESGV